MFDINLFVLRFVLAETLGSGCDSNISTIKRQVRSAQLSSGPSPMLLLNPFL